MVLSSFVGAETVELLDGERIIGRITKKTDQMIEVRSGSRRTQISIGSIARIYKVGEKFPPRAAKPPNPVDRLPRPFKSIPVKRDDQIRDRISVLLKGVDKDERESLYEKSRPVDRAMMPSFATIEKWSDGWGAPGAPGALGKTVEVDLPWQGDNDRVTAVIGLPSRYDPVVNSYPLIVGMHGREGHTASMTKIIAGAVDHGCFVVVPRMTNKVVWRHPDEVQNIFKCIGYVANRYRIDPRRIVICGGSAGGMGAWSIATMHPELFCAAGSFAAEPTLPVHNVRRLRDVPFYVMHGKADPIPIASVRPIVAEMRRLKMNHVFVEYDGGHYPSTKDKTAFRAWLQKAPPRLRTSPRPALLRFMKQASDESR